MSALSGNELEKPKTIKEIMVPLIAIIIGLFMVILDGTAVLSLAMDCYRVCPC
jgi:hypothetical protein